MSDTVQYGAIPERIQNAIDNNLLCATNAYYDGSGNFIGLEVKDGDRTIYVKPDGGMWSNNDEAKTALQGATTQNLVEKTETKKYYKTDKTTVDVTLVNGGKYYKVGDKYYTPEKFNQEYGKYYSSDNVKTEKIYANDRKSKTVTVANNGECYFVDGKKYTKEEYLKVFGEYYQTEAYYDPATNQMLTTRHYVNGEYTTDVNSSNSDQRMSAEEYTTKYGDYKKLNAGESSLFMDSEGHLHEIKFNGTNFEDVTDSKHVVDYNSLDSVEEAIKSNNWSQYEAKEKFDSGFTSEAGLFLNAELNYAGSAEFMALSYQKLNTYWVNPEAVVKQLNSEAQYDYSQLASIGEIDPSLSALGSKVAVTNSQELMINGNLFDDFLAKLQAYDKTISEGHKAIDNIRKNIATVDEDFAKEYNERLRVKIKELNKATTNKQVYFSNTMLDILNNSIASGMFTGSDLDVLKTIRDNSDFNINADGMTKLLSNMGTFLVSLVEGALKPFEAVFDGVCMLGAIGADILGIEGASDEILEFIGRDLLDEAYMACMVDSGAVNLSTAYGGAHDMGNVVGEIYGDILLWNTAPTALAKWTKAADIKKAAGVYGMFLNGFKLAGENAQKNINSDYYDPNDPNSKIWLYAMAGKDFAFGYGSKALFKKMQSKIANGDLGKLIYSRYGTNAYIGYAIAAQATGNAGLQLGSNFLNYAIDTAIYGAADESVLGNNILNAAAQGATSPISGLDAKEATALSKFYSRYSSVTNNKLFPNVQGTISKEGIGGVKNQDVLKYLQKLAKTASSNSDFGFFDTANGVLSMYKDLFTGAGKPK